MGFWEALRRTAEAEERWLKEQMDIIENDPTVQQCKREHEYYTQLWYEWFVKPDNADEKRRP